MERWGSASPAERVGSTPCYIGVGHLQQREWGVQSPGAKDVAWLGLAAGARA